MKKLLIAFTIAFISLFAQAQDSNHVTDSAYVFTSLIDLETTPVKNQYRSGTCWSFSAVSFLESELIRLGQKPMDLSEMFIVRKCYEYKADKYVRMHGETNFGGGGAFHDAFWVMENYGLLPEEAYPGLNYGEEKHVHGELDHVLKSYVDAIIANKNKSLSTAWKHGLSGLLDAYLGEAPESFDMDGETLSASDFLDKLSPLNPADYVSLTSYTHHPFYTTFILEIPDNWLWRESYNLPLDEMMAVFNNALKEGYTIAWGGDVSEKGFSFKNGLAIVPDAENPELSGMERSKWEALSLKDKEKQLFDFKHPVSEKVISQDLRQTEFDNFKTTDDHGMHITGMLKDQNDVIYYKVKNSWDTDNKYKGYLYMSEAFARLKTMNIVVHKDAIPKKLQKKLNL